MVWRGELGAGGVEAATAKGSREAGGGGSGEHLGRSVLVAVSHAVYIPWIGARGSGVLSIGGGRWSCKFEINDGRARRSSEGAAIT